MLAKSLRTQLYLLYLTTLMLSERGNSHPQRSGGRPYPEVTVAVLPSSLAKVLS